MESSSPDSYQHWENHRDNSRSSQNKGGMPRLRLFKTRAETKRKLSKDEIKNEEIQSNVQPQASNLHRSMSSPQFQVSTKLSRVLFCNIKLLLIQWSYLRFKANDYVVL
jgi:hypothetical protein